MFLRRIQMLRGVIFPWLLASRGGDHSMFPYESKFFDFYSTHGSKARKGACWIGWKQEPRRLAAG
jgi:hypothetical protein